MEDDGTPYIINGEHDYRIARLDNSMIKLAEEPRRISIDRKGVFPSMDKNSLHKHDGIYYLSCSGYYATSRELYGSYEYRGLVGRGPDLGVGEHTLIVQWPFRLGHGLEACYLLGDFGVTVAGIHARLISPVRSLAFDDWTKQGLPFYGGNVIYHCRATLPEAPLALRVPKFHAPLLAVDLDGQRVGRIIRPPHRVELPPSSGETQLDLTCFGDRINTFGALHNCNPQERWWGPPAYRTRAEHWTDGYVLRPKGIFVAPMIEQVAR